MTIFTPWRARSCVYLDANDDIRLLFGQGLTYLVVCCFCVYPIVWIVGSEGTAALGLSQQVAVHPNTGP